MSTLDFNGQSYLNGLASDPREVGWMRGAPPAEDKRITFDRDDFLKFPQIRWALTHMRELLPTVDVWRGSNGPSYLERRDRIEEIDRLQFEDSDGKLRSFGEALFDTYTDGIIVLHRGRVVYERYLGALEAHLPHACHSVTKSYAGTLAATLVHEGVLDASKTIAHYLPEMRGSGYEDATLRQVMDMQTAVRFTVDYSDGQSGIWAYARACGWRPRPVDYDGPQNLCNFLRGIEKQGQHGREFTYKVVDTEVMSWVVARVTGRSFAQLLSERIWALLGCEEDGYVTVDSNGMPISGAGLSSTLRDLARFGELMRREGAWNGAQLVPASLLDELKNVPRSIGSSGYSYTSQWWVSHNELEAFEARGIHGQRLYVAPKAEMVVARFASHPLASSAFGDRITLPQLLQLGRMLMS